MILNIVNNLKLAAINSPMCNQSSFGDITLYDNKSDIKYPYCNIDVVSGFVSDFSIEYTIRLYVCDRNEPYIAYNKTEQILTQILVTKGTDLSNHEIVSIYISNKDFYDKLIKRSMDIQKEYIPDSMPKPSLPQLNGDSIHEAVNY